jgi:polyhydroxyalkanoate synthesis regulator phasin
MKGYIEKILLAGIGACALTKEKAEKIVDDLVKKGKVTKKDHAELVKELLEKGKDTRAEFEAIVEKTVTSALKKLNIPAKSDIDALMKKIDNMTKKK